jgi:hypothetical protein
MGITLSMSRGNGYFIPLSGLQLPKRSVGFATHRNSLQRALVVQLISTGALPTEILVIFSEHRSPNTTVSRHSS